MKKIIQRIRIAAALAALLALSFASTGWAENYVYSNADSDSLASWSDPSYGTQTIQFKLNDPSSKLAVGNFPSSGYVQLTSISLSGRGDMSSYQNATKAVLTNNKTSESYTATVAYNADAFNASMDSSKISDAARREWTRMEVLMTFSSDGVLVDTDATYTLTFKNASDTNVTMGYSVVKNDSLNIGWTPAMRIRGRTPSGSMEMSSSLIPSSGGMTLPITVTVADAANYVFAADSITIGNSGMQITPASALNNQTVLIKTTIPSSASRLVGWTVSDTLEGYVSYSGSKFEQHYLNSGAVASTTYGTAAWTNDGVEHWLAVSYVRKDQTSATQETSGGTRTYLDGVQKIADASLKWGTIQTSKMTIGGTAANTTDAATGMVIKDLQIYNQGLSAQQIAKVTAALNSGWTVDATGTTLTCDDENGAALPGFTAAQVTAIGSVTVASDGTLDLSGLTQVSVGDGGVADVSNASGLTQANVSSGGELTIGAQCSGIVTALGGTLNVSYAKEMNDVILGYMPQATFTIHDASTFAPTSVTLDGQTVTPTVDGATVTLTGTPVAANPTATGDVWWWDYEFNGNVTSIGSCGSELSLDGNRPTASGYSAATLGDYTTAVDGNRAMYLLARPWQHVGDTTAASDYPSEFTAVMYCKAGTTANAVLVAFGSSNRGTTCNTIALATGDDPEKGEMRLVLIKGASSAAEDLVEGGFTLDNITSANHLYAFTIKTVGGNSQIIVYADGEVIATYTADGIISLGNGFQVGSIHGSITQAMGLNYLADGSNSTTADEATIDFLRVLDGELSSAAIRALATEYPYVSPNGIATRVVSANGNWSDDANNPWSQKTLNQDGSNTTTEQAAPNSGTVVDVVASTDATLTMNLESAVSYEKLTLEGEGAIEILKGDRGVAPTVTTRTYIKTDATISIDAFASLGAITVDDGKTLTLVPASSTATTAVGLGVRGATSSIVTGTVTLGDGAAVVLDSESVAQFAYYGITLSLGQNASQQYVLTIERGDRDIVITKTANGTETATMGGELLFLPAIPETIPFDFSAAVTIVNNSTADFTVSTVFDGCTVPVVVNAGAAPVVLTGDSTFGGAVSGTAALTISGDITLASGGSIANTISGTGMITLSSLSQSLSFGDWTGTVVLPAIASGEISLNNYGIAGSAVRLGAGMTGGYLSDAEILPTIDIPSGQTMTLNHFSASFANTIDTLTGAGELRIMPTDGLDVTGNKWYSNYSAYFLLKDVSGFTGSLTIPTDGKAGIAIASAKPAYTTPGGAIRISQSGVAIASGATWSAPDGIVLTDANASITVSDMTLSPEPTTTVANSYVKSVTVDGTTTYSVEAYKTLTIVPNNSTVTVATNGVTVAGSSPYTLEAGTVTLTVAPTTGYLVGGVMASSGEVTGEGPYSYTVTGDATITVTTVSTALTIGAATVEYLADFSKAKTVSATVTAGTVLDGTTWTLKTNGVVVAGAAWSYADATVTFSDIGVTLGDSIVYSIEASGVSTGTSATAPASTVGNVTSGWIQEDSTNHESTGMWATDFTYTDGKATITNNTYTPTTTGDGIVTLTTVVKFGNEADPEVSVGDGAQAAFRVSDGKFEVYGKAASNGEAGWQTTEVAADVEETYTVTLIINYNTKTFTATAKEGEGDVTALGGTWYLATSATRVSSIAYKGMGAFTSLSGSFISDDIDVSVDAKGVAVSRDFISQYLAGKTVTEATTALDPNATNATDYPSAFAPGGNGINYFNCYALGLDPTKEEDKPIVDVTTDANGKFVFKVKHPVFDEQGKITGYEEIKEAGNVTTSITLKYGTGAASLTGSASADAIAPADMFKQGGVSGNVIYYKAEVTIGAK